MIAFKKQGKLIYIDNQQVNDITHFVSEKNWDEYMELRKNKPTLCRIFSTVYETFQAAQKVLEKESKS